MTLTDIDATILQSPLQGRKPVFRLLGYGKCFLAGMVLSYVYICKILK